MKTLQKLKKESIAIQSEIKQLLLDNYRYDHALKDKLDVIEKVTSLRQNLSTIQREIRERLAA
jgi:hypothetical protein